MSWSSIWQTSNQAQGTGSNMSGGTQQSMGMYQLSAEQQYWQQWQLYQTQLAQWQAQYGDRYQQMQSSYMQNIAPPLPIDHQPPPPPPPIQNPLVSTQENAPNLNAGNVVSNTKQTTNKSAEELLASTKQQNQQSIAPNRMSTTQLQSSSSDHLRHDQNVNFENSNFLQQNEDGFRNQLQQQQQQQFKNSPWNNNNLDANRMLGGNSLNSRNAFDYNDEGNKNDAPSHQIECANEEKSQEEIAFDAQFRKWEDSFMEWKQNNADHPDQGQYNDFVIKMEGCRKQLLQRREMLRQKRLESIRREAQMTQSIDQIKEQVDTNEHVNSSEMLEKISESASGSGCLFTTTSKDADIPGLDLVSEEKPSKPDINVVVNNILGNPEIQSLLSNIQRQQNETSEQFQDIDKTNEDNQRQISIRNNFDSIDTADHCEKYQLSTEINHPFRPNNNNEVFQCSTEQLNSGYNWKDNFSNDQLSNIRDRNCLPQQQSTNPEQFRKHNPKRPRDSSEAFDNNDCAEFQPLQVIDYQNRTQNQSTFEDRRSCFNDNFYPSNKAQSETFFSRKMIEYDHKSKVHPWNWFCPVIQIEYNHTKTGISLHEYPQPKHTEKLQTEQKSVKYGSNNNFKQLRQPKWSPDRLVGVAHGSSGQGQEQFQNYQSRYENRLNIPPTNDTYYRRNLIRNIREWKEPHDRCPDTRIGTERSVHYCTLPNIPSSSTTASSSLYPRIDMVPNDENKTKHSLKDLLFPPGRNTRPKRIVILMRGIPGSGKSYVAKMIKDKEQEMGGSARILSIDDYFMTETNCTDVSSVKRQKATSKQSSYECVSYKYDGDMEETYTQYLLKAFKKTCTDNLFDCIIVDYKNTTLEYLTEFYMIAKTYMFTPFICELPLDLEKCLKNNIHNRSEIDIRKALNEWVPTPSSYTVLDYDCLFNSADDIEEISDVEDDKDLNVESLDTISEDDNINAEKDTEDELSDEPMNEFGVFRSKWDNDTTENKLARLDGIDKPIKHQTIEDYLQMDGWIPPPASTNGKKRVRWADIEEKREQDKQRAIGFVVGQTDWNALLEQPRDHTDALAKIKYIEKVRK